MANSPVSLSILDSVRVASPCHVSWDSMTGDERTRHCASCNLCVHNLSGMTRPEAEAFLHGVAERQRIDPDARACAYFFRRPDGTILTQDCPVGLAAIRRKTRLAAARAVAAVGAVIATVWGVAGANSRGAVAPRVRELEPFNKISQWLAPFSYGSSNMPRVAGGIVCIPPTNNTTATPDVPSDGDAESAPND